MSALVLPDPADIRLPELREKVIPRIIEGLAAIEGAGDASQADELVTIEEFDRRLGAAT